MLSKGRNIIMYCDEKVYEVFDVFYEDECVEEKIFLSSFKKLKKIVNEIDENECMNVVVRSPIKSNSEVYYRISYQEELVYGKLEKNLVIEFKNHLIHRRMDAREYLGVIAEDEKVPIPL
jgi:hypothetical protein